MGDNRLKIVQGTVDLLVLRALTRGPEHGYGVTAWVRERSGGEIGIDEAALYQALHQLERRGRVASEWGVWDDNRRAKYYEITRKGRRRHLTQVSATWRRYAHAVSAVLDAP